MSSNTITINNGSGPMGTAITDRFPPNAAMDMGSLVTLFKSMTPSAVAPTSPTENDVYLDDGTNTESGQIGFRIYIGTEWEDFGVQDILETIALEDLSDVTINVVADGDRLVYDADSGEWINENVIDGGSY